MPEQILERMRERLYAARHTRRARKAVRIDVMEMAAFADALARTLDERNEFAARVRGTGKSDTAAPQSMPVR